MRLTCETAGDMEANLAGNEVAAAPRSFPPANWGPWVAVLGVIAALGTGVFLSIPGLLAGENAKNELTTLGNILVQIGTALGFLLVPMAIAASRGGKGLPQILSRLGVRKFSPSAFKWMAATVGLYLLATALYAGLITEPHQKDIAEAFGPIAVQVVLIVIAAPISEELCFRGLLYGGLRERLPRYPAALITGLIFGGLHATTGISAVPPLIIFGFLLALLYEKTDSIVPGIMLHMLNNIVALLGQ